VFFTRIIGRFKSIALIALKSVVALIPEIEEMDTSIADINHAV